MRKLAEFIMRGRWQAALVAVVGNWVPLLTPATLGLVTLRAGWSNGLLVLLWGLLPALLTLGFSEVQALVPMLAISSALVCYAAALLLRQSASWPQALFASVALASLIGLGSGLWFPGLLRQIGEQLSDFLHLLQPEADLAPLNSELASGMLAYGVAFSGLLGLILARWWQALLYNPSGFAQEFQALRLTQLQALISLAAGIYCLLQGAAYLMWSVLFTLPLLFQGLAIVHKTANLRSWGRFWLGLFYAALVLIDVLSQLLVLLAFLDTWLNFRKRLNKA